LNLGLQQVNPDSVSCLDCLLVYSIFIQDTENTITLLYVVMKYVTAYIARSVLYTKRLSRIRGKINDKVLYKTALSKLVSA